MRIGELAKATDCNIETIRYYEKAGLLEEPRRTSSGYREYQTEHLERLQFIRHCRSLQMGLPEIKVLLQLRHEPEAGCKQVDALLEQQIERVHAQIVTLQKLEQQLTALRRRCPAPRSIEECGILQDLQKEGTSKAAQ